MAEDRDARAGTVVKREVVPPFSSIPAALEAWAGRTPQSPALTSAAGVQTYAQLATAVAATAMRLRNWGVERGDRVVLAGHNTVGWVHHYLAALRLGAIAVPANVRLSSRQFADQVSVLASRYVLVDEEHRLLAAELPNQYVRDVVSGVACDPSESEPLAAVDNAVRPDAPALISFTSGTTGVPKGAVLTHKALATASAVFADALGTGPADSTLVMAPLFHNTGFVDQLGQMLVVGGRTDLLREYHTKDAVAALHKRPTTFLTAVPSVIRLLMLADDADAVFGPARVLLYGGSPMPAAWIDELLEQWPHLRLYHGYGLTEFTSAVTLLPPEHAVERGDSVGFPVPGVTIRLLDEQERDCVPGDIGEVWVCGPTRMTQYWQRPDATGDKLRGDWLRTGDLGRFEGPFLYLEGRLDDVINRGGEKVLPAYVESVLAERPDVAQASVFGAPHPILQQRVVAVVQPRSDGHFDEVAARAHLARVLPDYAIPEEFVVAADLPQTASGKVDRRAIAAQFLTSQVARPRKEHA